VQCSEAEESTLYPAYATQVAVIMYSRSQPEGLLTHLLQVTFRYTRCFSGRPWQDRQATSSTTTSLATQLPTPAAPLNTAAHTYACRAAHPACPSLPNWLPPYLDYQRSSIPQAGCQHQTAVTGLHTAPDPHMQAHPLCSTAYKYTIDDAQLDSVPMTMSHRYRGTICPYA
jgi:hypothetical protein